MKGLWAWFSNKSPSLSLNNSSSLSLKKKPSDFSLSLMKGLSAWFSYNFSSLSLKKPSDFSLSLMKGLSAWFSYNSPFLSLKNKPSAFSYRWWRGYEPGFLGFLIILLKTNLVPSPCPWGHSWCSQTQPRHGRGSSSASPMHPGSRGLPIWNTRVVDPYSLYADPDPAFQKGLGSDS